MLFRDYPIGKGALTIPANVDIITRERGKIVPRHCRSDHNIWVDLGREYLARVVSPNTGRTDHYSEPPREFVSHMGVGIGGDSQGSAQAFSSPLKDDYPPGIGQGSTGNQYSDEVTTVQTLERPVKLSSTSPIWLAPVATPVTFTSSTRVRFDRVFSETDVNGVGPYTIVPLSEVALFLSTQDPDASNVYDALNTPSYVGAGRQTVVAYNTFSAIPKSASFSLEIRWELRF